MLCVMQYEIKSPSSTYNIIYLAKSAFFDYLWDFPFGGGVSRFYRRNVKMYKLLHNITPKLQRESVYGTTELRGCLSRFRFCYHT